MRSNISEILSKHKLYLQGKEGGVRANLREVDLSGADLRYANLRYVNLREADLRGADIDYCSLTLSCNTLDVHFDERQLIQLLYHCLRNVQFSKNVSEEFKQALLTKQNIEIANRFHRRDCKRLEVYQERMKG